MAIRLTLGYLCCLGVKNPIPPSNWYYPGSLWFYAVRFFPLNPTRSLLPCVAAHATKNLGVIALKYAQGFGDGWW